MCGIIGAVSNHTIAEELIVGLKRLEYRGYDSAGIAVIDEHQQLICQRVMGKIEGLEKKTQGLKGNTGIAHTRWATHGKPTEKNAHPHLSHDTIAIVHNGIVENHKTLRAEIISKGITPVSETDSELIAHLIYLAIQKGDDFLSAVYRTIQQLEGTYAIAVINKNEPHRLIAVRKGSPLVVGYGVNQICLGSDLLAIKPLVSEVVYLKDGDLVDVTLNKTVFYDSTKTIVTRDKTTVEGDTDKMDKEGYDHYMLKEIMEQPTAMTNTLAGRIADKEAVIAAFGESAKKIFERVKRVQFVACGTSYHAAMIGKNWFEDMLNLPAQVEIASEFRYRKKVVEEGTLFVSISQSGETADTLAAMRLAKEQHYLATLTICNVATSTLVRESDCHLLTRAGFEIGVASTKAFTTQLGGLLLLALGIGFVKRLPLDEEVLHDFKKLPLLLQNVLMLDPQVKKAAAEISRADNAIFLGRGNMYSVALEGALKLKEISYIHAEAFAAGELKHGPLALVDKNMPVIALLPNDDLSPKVQSNLEEVKARDGQLFIFANKQFTFDSSVRTIAMPDIHPLFTPFIYVIPMQLLAYHAALFKGTDIDQPRNLAKSVTVE